MKRTTFLFALGAFLCLGACKEDVVSGIGGGGSGGTSSTSTSTGTKTDDHCHGDEAKWAEITAGPFACTKNSDCCVVTNGCLSQVQMVRAADYEAAKTAWPYCDDVCTGCITPAVKVSCVNGACAGEIVDFEQFQELTMDHCGEDPMTVDTPSGKEHFGCGD